MTNRDWQRIEMALREWFPAGERWAATDGPEAYRLHLDTVHELDAAAVFKAVVALSRHQKFRPSPGEILERVQGRASDSFVTPDQAWPLIEAAIRMVSGSTTDPRFHDRHQDAINWLRTQDLAVAAWAAQRGLRGRGSLGMEEVNHPQYGGAALKRLADDYASVRGRAAERMQLGQPAFPERAFLVRGTGDRDGSITDLVERLRPARELPAGAEAA